MRQVTFALEVDLGCGISMFLIPQRTITENEAIGKFDELVRKVKALGCKYAVEHQAAPITIESNGTF